MQTALGLVVEVEVASVLRVLVETECLHARDIARVAALFGIKGKVAVERSPNCLFTAAASSAARREVHGICRGKRDYRGEDGEGWEC